MNSEQLENLTKTYIDGISHDVVIKVEHVEAVDHSLYKVGCSFEFMNRSLENCIKKHVLRMQEVERRMLIGR